MITRERLAGHDNPGAADNNSEDSEDWYGFFEGNSESWVLFTPVVIQW